MSAALCPTLAVLTTEHRAKPSARRPARASAVSRTFRRSRDAVVSRAKDATDEALTEVANMDSLIDLMVAADGFLDERMLQALVAQQQEQAERSTLAQFKEVACNGVGGAILCTDGHARCIWCVSVWYRDE